CSARSVPSRSARNCLWLSPSLTAAATMSGSCAGVGMGGPEGRGGGVAAAQVRGGVVQGFGGAVGMEGAVGGEVGVEVGGDLRGGGIVDAPEGADDMTVASKVK